MQKLRAALSRRGLVETDHDRIEELLAGYALRSLSGEDAREADRVLSQHVPGCATCRATLQEFQVVHGRARARRRPGRTARDPPASAAPRDGTAARRRRPGSVVAAAASIVVVVGMAGLAVGQGIRASNADQRRALYSDALQLASQPDASQIPLVDTQTSGPPVTEIVAPGVEVVYLVCNNVARPRPGMTYRVWLRVRWRVRVRRAVRTRVRPHGPAVECSRRRSTASSSPRSRSTAPPTQPEAATIRWSDAA